MLNIEGLLKIFIKDDIKGDTIVFNQWKLKHDVLDTSIINSQILVGTLGFIIPEGSFTCEITGSDIHNPEKFKVIKENYKSNSISASFYEYQRYTTCF